MKIHNFKKLTIWLDAIDLCDRVYDYTESLPLKERYNLIQQLEKCAVSIPANIAEGSAKRTAIHFSEFLSTALGSSYEAQTHLMICQRRNYGSPKVLEQLISDIEQLQGKIFNFRESVLGG